jgi:hypothetical protein
MKYSKLDKQDSEFRCPSPSPEVQEAWNRILALEAQLTKAELALKTMRQILSEPSNCGL